MADERVRVASRREPIITVVEVDGKKLKFEAKPISRWRARNDAGNKVVAEYTKAMNAFVHGYNEGDDFLLTGQLFEHAMPYLDLFEAFYPDGPKDDFELLDYDSMIAVLDAALEVNDLQSQAYMLDPRKKEQRLETNSPSSSADDGAKMESSADSG